MERFGIIHFDKSLTAEIESSFSKGSMDEFFHSLNHLEKDFIKFETCMRKIYFFDSTRLSESALSFYHKQIKKVPQINLFESEQAYSFILEVIAGLKSSIKGETEIFGQFKIFYDHFKTQDLVAMGGLLKTFEQLILDCKHLREKHIKNWGSQSYGSVSRKLLDKNTPVILLGSGHLAQEIAPWLEQNPNKVIVTRESSKTRFNKEFATFKNISYQELPALLKAQEGPVNIILAAPIANSCIQDKLAMASIKTFIDWRGDHRWLESNYKEYYHLSDIKNQFIESEESLNQKVHLVRQEIQTLVEKLKKKVQLNPWGWDDICA